MTVKRAALLLATLPLLAGCTFIRPKPRTPDGAPPSKTMGYVGGKFDKDTFVGFGFVVADEARKDEHVIEVEKQSVGLIALPPGRYQVVAWVTWALTGEQLTRKEIPSSSAMGSPFDVAPGQVTFLGAWSADRFGTTYVIQAGKMTEAQAAQALGQAYPRFAEAPVRCPMCVE